MFGHQQVHGSPSGERGRQILHGNEAGGAMYEAEKTISGAWSRAMIWIVAREPVLVLARGPDERVAQIHR
jgi:hypothetical protein